MFLPLIIMIVNCMLDEEPLAQIWIKQYLSIYLIKITYKFTKEIDSLFVVRQIKPITIFTNNSFLVLRVCLVFKKEIKEK